MSKEDDVYSYRKDTRSDEEYEKAIESSSQEWKYMVQAVERHNYKRKKRELTIEKWGNKDTKITKKLKLLKKYLRPDFILNVCYDNSYMVKDKQPIEVQTCSTLHPPNCCIKKSKMDWNFDETTEEVCNKKTIILFVVGTNFPGKEKFAFLRPKFLDKIKENGISYPIFLGGKPSYCFDYQDAKWNSFNNFSNQQILKKLYDNEKDITSR